MKNIFKSLAMIALGTAMLTFASCSKTEDDAETYAIIYAGETLADGATITLQPSQNEIDMDFASIELLIDNKTTEKQETVMKVDMTEGPEAMKDLMVCYGETCKNPTCPWTSDPFVLVPGVNEEMAIKFDYIPSKVSSTTVYCMTVAKAGSMKSPRVLNIKIETR